MEEIIKGMPDGAEAIQKNFAELVGKTQGQSATFKDFAEVAADMVKYSGAFTVAGVSIDNAPFANPWYVGQVITGTSEKNGAIIAFYFAGGMKVTTVSDGKIIGWHELATTDNAGIIDWQANIDVKKGQLVTFKTLGTISTGMLTNPIFMSLVDQNTGSSFLAADSLEGVSGKWKLMNPDAYAVQYTTAFYGISATSTNKGMLVKRIGNRVYAYMNPATKDIGADYGFENAKLPAVFAPLKLSEISSSSTYIRLEQPGTDSSALLIWDGGSLQTKGSYPNGSLYSGEYSTNAAMAWPAGVPSV